MKKSLIIFFLIATVIMFIGSQQVKAQSMDGLDKKQQKIVTIAANTAVGNLDQLREELAGGLEAGLTVNEIKEVLIQMYAYCGFPRSLQGINTFMHLLENRKVKGIRDTIGRDASLIDEEEDKYVRGKNILEMLTLYHETSPTGANAFAPAIDKFLKEHLFADIFERDVLSFSQRELATISALAAMSGVEPMLQSHLNMGMNTGLTEVQLKEVFLLIGETVSWDQVIAGSVILEKVLESRR